MEGNASSRRYTVVAVAIFAGSLLSGCTSVWHAYPGSPPFSDASSLCRSKGRLQFPVKNEVAYRTVYAKREEPCRGAGEKCDDEKRKINYVEHPEIQTYVLDINEYDRDQEYTACMSRQGWRLKSDWFWKH